MKHHFSAFGLYHVSLWGLLLLLPPVLAVQLSLCISRDLLFSCCICSLQPWFLFVNGILQEFCLGFRECPSCPRSLWHNPNLWLNCLVLLFCNYFHITGFRFILLKAQQSRVVQAHHCSSELPSVVLINVQRPCFPLISMLVGGTSASPTRKQSPLTVNSFLSTVNSTVSPLLLT